MARKMIRTWIILSIMGISGLLTSGCVVMGQKEIIVREGETVKQVEFESEQAGILFRKTSKPIISRKDKQNESFVIPFIIAYQTTKTLSENARYNDEINKCDTDGDGYITLTEARIYSGTTAATKENECYN